MFREPIPIGELLLQGVKDKKILQVGNKNVPPKGDKKTCRREEFKYKVEVEESKGLSEKDYEATGKEVKKMVENSGKSSNFFTIKDVTDKLTEGEDDIKTFLNMAVVRRQVQPNKSHPGAFSISKPVEIPKSVKDIPYTSPEVWDAHKDRTFGRKASGLLLKRNQVACSFFGCSYVGSSTSVSHHYVS